MVNLQILQLLEKKLGKGTPKSDDNVAFYCPICKHRKQKLEVDMGTGEWSCWVCRDSLGTAGKNFISLFKLIKANSETIIAVKQLLNQSGKKFINDKNSNSNEKKKNIALPLEFISMITPRNTIDYKQAMAFLKSRKIFLDDIIRYNIGYCESGKYAGRIIIPSYDSNGNLTYFVSRKYFDNGGLKYLNPDVSKDFIGFELQINWKMPIVIVEGAFDAIAVKRNAIPLFGKTLPANLKKAIIEYNVNDIYIALDNDAVQDALNHAEYFINNGRNVYLITLTDKDPSEMGYENFQALLKNTQPLKASDLFRLKLFTKGNKNGKKRYSTSSY